MRRNRLSQMVRPSLGFEEDESFVNLILPLLLTGLAEVIAIGERG